MVHQCPLLNSSSACERVFRNANCSIFIGEKSNLLLQKGWSRAGAAPSRDQLWLQGLQRSRSLCIVWRLLFLQYLLDIPYSTEKQQKGIKTSYRVSYNISFKAGFVSYPSVVAISLPFWLERGKRLKNAFHIFCKTKQNKNLCFASGGKVPLHPMHTDLKLLKKGRLLQKSRLKRRLSFTTYQKARGQDLAVQDF